MEIIKKRINKDEVKELYLMGYNSAEIASVIGVKREAVKKCIQRNFKQYYDMHCEAREDIISARNRWRERDCKKAINTINNRYMGNSQLISWNRQSYKTNSNGTLVFDISRGTLPGDLPKRYRAII